MATTIDYALMAGASYISTRPLINLTKGVSIAIDEPVCPRIGRLLN